jgi:membrane protein YdbS with pleckstrin-like domain
MTADIQHIITETSIAFDKSPIKKFATDKGLNWYYSISSTRLTTDNNVIVGFNWGAADNFNYQPQTEIPTENFKDLYDKKWLGSLQRIYEPLKEYFPYEDIDNCVQTNFCFFRSKEENQITPTDLQLSTPLFQNLLDIIKPKRIVGFSNKLRDYFLNNNLCTSVETLNIPSNGKTLFVAKGIYRVNGRDIPIFFLPHPNSQFTSAARHTAWEFCFESNDNIKSDKPMDTEKEIFKGNPSQVLNFWTFISCIFIIPIPFAFWNWLQVKCTKLTLTNQRIIMSAGVFSKLTHEVELYRIRDVAVEEPLLYRLFGLGHIVIYSTDKASPTVRLMAFKNPHWLKDKIRESAEYYRQNRRWGTIN